MNNHVSRNKFFKEYNWDYACDPQKHIPRKFVRVQYHVAQHKIFTNYSSQVKFDKQLYSRDILNICFNISHNICN